MELPPEDIDYLNSQYHDKWYKQQESGKFGVVIEEYCLPDGYEPYHARLMLLIPSGYPASGIDMFYFDPGVCRQDGVSINALGPEEHFGRHWQRWSRHYQWRPGIDNLSTHITFIGNQLNSELPKGR